MHFLAFRDREDPLESAVGAARLWVDDRGTAKAQRVAVLAEARKSGAGRVLMREVEAAARKRGHALLQLAAQRDAIPFYERLGYVAHGDEFEDAGIPHRMMRLLLT